MAKLIPALSNLRGVSLHGEDAPDEAPGTAQHVLDEIRPLWVGERNCLRK